MSADNYNTYQKGITVKRFIISLAGLALVATLGAGCDLSATTHRVKFFSSGVSGLDCPTDGTVFAYGSCHVPAGVADIPATMLTPDSVGSPVQISDPVGCGLEVVPAGYTVDGTYLCQPVR